MSDAPSDPRHREEWATLESERPRRSWLGRVMVWGGGAVVALFVAAMFIPLCGCSTRVPAYYAATKSDLKNLASQEEIYFSDQYSYTAVVSDLAFVNSDGVIVRILATDKGWTAAAGHVALGYESGCAVYYGDTEWPMRTPGGIVPEYPAEVVCDPR